MTEVTFYQLTQTTLEKTLPKLLEKAYQAAERVVVYAESEDRLDQLDHSLWTYAQLSFLPHATYKDTDADLQPIWLTNKVENPNNSDILVVLDGAEVQDVSGFRKCFDVFEGVTAASVEAADQRVQKAQQKGCRVIFWQQSENGQWKQRANV